MLSRGADFSATAGLSCSELCLVFVVSVHDLSSVTYFPACTDVNGTVA